MYYAFDNSHSEPDSNFVERISRAIEHTKDLELFIEDLNFSEEEKKTKDKVWTALGQGKVNLEKKGGEYRIKWDSGSAEVRGTNLIIARALYKKDNHLSKVDSGPVFGKDIKDNALKVQKAQNGETSINKKELSGHIMNRDILTAEHIIENVRSPDNTLVIMGASHNLDYLLSNEYSVSFLNERNVSGFVEQCRKNALEYLEKNY